MKKILAQSILLGGLGFASLVIAGGMPPKDDFTLVVQPSGEKLPLMVYGDQHYRWLETRQGYVVLRNKDTGAFEFAIIVNEDGKSGLALSGILATVAEPAVNTDANTGLKDNNAGSSEEKTLTFAKHADAVKIRMQKFKANHKKTAP